MRKLLLVFTVAWAVYCLINTGYEVTQPKWRENLKQNPAVLQVEAGDIFNHGVFAIKDAGLNQNTQAVLFVEQDLGFLSALPLGYWLYPSTFTPASNNPLSSGGASTDSAGALARTVAMPRSKTIYFVGHQKTLDKDSDILTNYKEIPVAKESDQVFFILERK